MTSVALPALALVHSVTVTQNPSLAELSLPLVAHVIEVRIAKNDVLVDVNLRSMQTFGLLRISENAALQVWPFAYIYILSYRQNLMADIAVSRECISKSIDV